MTGLIIAAIVLIALATPAGFLMRWIMKQRKEYKFWLRLTDGQEATEL